MHFNSTHGRGRSGWLRITIGTMEPSTIYRENSAFGCQHACRYSPAAYVLAWHTCMSDIAFSMTMQPCLRCQGVYICSSLIPCKSITCHSVSMSVLWCRTERWKRCEHRCCCKFCTSTSRACVRSTGSIPPLYFGRHVAGCALIFQLLQYSCKSQYFWGVKCFQQLPYGYSSERTNYNLSFVPVWKTFLYLGYSIFMVLCAFLEKLVTHLSKPFFSKSKHAPKCSA